MIGNLLKPTLTLFLFLLAAFAVQAQEPQVAAADGSASKININLGADLVSRYVWRGTDFSDSPGIQPFMSVAANNFELGCWSAVSATNSYKEVDLYAKYTVKGFSAILTDYYIPLANGNAASPDNRYFIWDDKKTAHTMEGALMYKGDEKFPLWVSANVFFYGNDKRWGYDIKKDTTDESYYSSYFEAGYTFNINGNSLDAFMGFTPAEGAYGNTLGVVNMGFTGYRKVKISDDYELPLKASLIFNPQASAVCFVFGITL